MPPVIETTFDDGIAILRMAHGPVNALDIDLLKALPDALEDARSQDANAVVLTGSGPTFSAGADLVRYLDEGSDFVERARPHAARAFREMFLFPLPAVAAINGHAIAGGCVLACACDHRVAAAGDYRIGLAELKAGVPFPVWALETVRFALAPPHFQRLIYSGRLPGPDEALATGLVDEVVPPEELLGRALAIARKLSSVPRGTFSLTKRSLREPYAERARAAESTDDEGAAVWASDETRESVRRFIERTLGTS